jgi:hypothetical protein
MQTRQPRTHTHTNQSVIADGAKRVGSAASHAVSAAKNKTVSLVVTSTLFLRAT